MPRAAVLVLALIFLSGAAVHAAPDAGPDPQAVALVTAALRAQGGEARLRAIEAVRVRWVGYRNMLEQSIRPDGPYIPEFWTGTDLRDQRRGRLHQTGTGKVYVGDGEGFDDPLDLTADATAAVQRAGGKASPDARQVAPSRERLALSPERLLLTALAAGDLRRLPPAVVQGQTHEVVGFSLDGAPVRLYLDRRSKLPVGYDYSGPLARSGYWSFRGDHTVRTVFSNWALQADGVRLPMQIDDYGDGRLDRNWMIDRIEINPRLDEAEFAIPPEARAAAIAAPAATTAALKAQELAPGVLLLAGSWNVVIVRQADGLVVLEAPISSAYSERVIRTAAERFPGAPIKAVISTSDSWPHIAGLRPYVARGVPVYLLDLNLPAVSSIVANPHTNPPDTLQQRPRKPVFRPVTAPLSLGVGENRLELIPLRGLNTERQMMVYLPGQRLLYASDAFQPKDADHYYTPEQVLEVAQAVARAHLDIDRAVLMHLGVTPWTKIVGSLPKAAR